MPSPTAKDSLVTIGIAFLVILAANALVALVLGLSSGDFSADPARIAGPGLVVQGICMLAFVVHVAARTDDGAVRALGAGPATRWWLVPLIVPAGLLSDLLIQELARLAPVLDQGGLDALSDALGNQQVWILVGAVGLAPFYEELLFRGLAWRGFERSLGRWPALLLTSVLFAAFHGDPLHVAGVFVLGLWLGWIRMATGSVVPSIAAHLINNLSWALLGGTLPIESLPRWAALPCLLLLVGGAALSLKPPSASPSSPPPPAAPGAPGP